ncbi:MAG TPA: hypothetical protein VGK89_13300 [Candidatus Eisenbacteria bacterium]|jgi:hypothetical protein
MSDENYGAGRPLDALNARGLTAKREYVRGLEQRRDPEALSLLVECLCDESWFLRDLAEQAFFRMGVEQVGELLPLLQGGLWYTRLSAARLLGRLGYRPAVPSLVALCDDPNASVALAAREAVLAVARQRGSSRVAHALHRLPPERRRRRLAEIADKDRALAKSLERMFGDVDLMEAADPDRLVDPGEGAPASDAGKTPAAPPAAKSGAGAKAPASGKPPAAQPPATPASAKPKASPASAKTPAPSESAPAPASAKPPVAKPEAASPAAPGSPESPASPAAPAQEPPPGS